MFGPLFAVIALALVGYAIWLAVAVGAILAAASDGRDALERSRESAEALDFEAALVDLRLADDTFDRAQRHLSALAPLKALPWVGTHAKAAAALVDSGRSVVAALEEAVEIGADLVRLSGLSAQDLADLAEGAGGRVSFEDLPSDTKRAMLRRLVSSADEIDRTVASIAIARDELSDLDRTALSSPVLAALAPVDAKLAGLEAMMRLLARAARVLPAFAGADGTKTALLQFLNDTELRPGGGFIGTYGVLEVKDADIASLSTHDVYELDGAAAHGVTEPPPPPLNRYLGADKWFFRDANWSPDFAVSAETSLRLFALEERASGRTPTAFDGVIGFTTGFAADLLRLTGPLEAGGQTFTPENVADRLEYQVEFGYAGQGIPPEQRKAILSELVEKMKSEVYALPSSRWSAFATVVERALVDKRLMLYSRDAKAQAVIASVGWGGAVKTPAWGDALMVVDANLASLKSDPSVHRSVRYAIAQNASGEYVGRTTIRYEHAGRFDWKTTRYRTYTRVYAPYGSKLLRVEGSLADDKIRNPSLAAGSPDVFTELGFTTFGAFTAVEPGQTRELAFEYLLAQSVVDAIRSGSYRLAVFKQAGAADNGLTLHLDFGKNLTDASVPEDLSRWGDDTYNLNTKLDQDLVFEVDL
ncbi:hypothetical protein A2856_03355 [Candidatus Uhrbacteria bacterium RIFCSPHIGHO2_01_FULL_63_20]|uniref:DUF4012 domain-containing protein n=1 Tax=Candidatus Uhrbacteria bacterium RIFCSPHIGHO2_01_FULL_63_20 TaxID=1802385 RepID=A0A1F7TLB1_9BACT|nr:MAG: hypothetical protein A2856_03355 [Candidatus Uhrbacteria bacterium RIFCSPHIGHO2_01_FULL_63_20]